MKIVHLVPSMESGGVEQVVMELGSGLSAGAWKTSSSPAADA